MGKSTSPQAPGHPRPLTIPLLLAGPGAKEGAVVAISGGHAEAVRFPTGARLEVICFDCGVVNKATSTQCTDCGTFIDLRDVEARERSNPAHPHAGQSCGA